MKNISNMKNILLTIGICLLLPCGFIRAQAPTVYLPLDADLQDASGNNLHATDAGTESTKFEADAQRGPVARFPIGAHATLPLDPKLDFGTNDFSVAFWIRIDNTTIPTSDPAILGNKDWDSGGNTGFVVSLHDADDAAGHRWKVNASDHNGQRLDWEADQNGAATLVDATWHFVAVTFDRDGTMNVYMDGVLKQTDASPSSKDMTLIPGDLAPDALPFTIMQDATGHYGSDFEAFLDDILIYSRVLTAAEVTDLNDNGYHIDPALGATVYLPFDGDLNDASGNGLNATDAGTAHTSFDNDADRGMVANFPAAAHATLPLDPALDLSTEDFTVAFWIKIDDTTIPGSDPSIISNKDWDSGGNAGFVVSLNNADDPTSDLWKVNTAAGAGTRLDWAASKNDAPNLVDGTWHFVAVAFDRQATMNVYVDGALKQTDAAANSKDLTLITGNMDAGLPLTIMQDGTGHYGQDFAAWLDDVRIWKGKALSAGEIAAVYAFVPAKPEDDLSYGADAYLPFDSDLKDATGHGLDATDKGTVATTFIDDAERGKVANFPAEAYAQFPLDPKLDIGTGNFSVAFWVKIDAATPVPSDPVIFGNKDWDSGGNRGFIIGLDDADSPDAHHWTVSVSDGDGSRLDWDADDNQTANLKDGKWHFVAVAFDRDAKLNVYLDGLLHQSDPAPDSYDMTLIPGSLTPAHPLTIMQDGTGAYPADFAARLDDLRLWKDKVLTAAEVAAMYNPADKPYEATVFLPLNSNLADFSGHGINAADAGAEPAQFIKDPDRGDVALFPARAHAQFPLAPELDFGTNDFSVGFWVKINPLIPVPSDPVIIGNKNWDSGGNRGFIVGLDDADVSDAHHWTVSTSDGNGGRLDWDADDNQTGNLKDGSWHFVLVAYDRDAKMNVYFDGALKQTDPAQDSYDMSLIPGSLTSGLPLTIMQDGTGAYSADFSSLLDNIRIWNRVVTPQEVSKIYNEDKGNGAGGDGEIIVGVPEAENHAPSFVAYPNPTNGGNVTLAYRLPRAADLQLSLLNSQGMLLKSWTQKKSETEGLVTVDTAYEPGLYLLQVESANIRKIIKIIIVK
ncbi:T9SS C-terminal target domain-containing protein [Chryseolinea soli]|uniref:T9SS C-terminal target domain-containing protein n=2 Tax=Chryseolinea soli TaxID=2321403 RepID=A0A385SP21_9BACT|nr:T9SS C-terminal target domain-containing protein [Chryseolinea soli]